MVELRVLDIKKEIIANLMDYMKQIEKELKGLGVDTLKIVFGRGCNKTSDKRNRKPRYEFYCSRVSKDTQYAIQYCKDIKQYIVWKASKDLYRRKFTVIADNVPIAKNNEVLSTVKGKEFIWKDTEDVYSFTVNGIEEFAKRFLLTGETVTENK